MEKMKKLFEDWRTHLSEQESSCEDVVWHGSRADFTGAVRASQAHDVSGHPEQNLIAVYATENKKMAMHRHYIARILTCLALFESNGVKLVKIRAVYGPFVTIF